jgi:hypothetical protein
MSTRLPTVAFRQQIGHPATVKQVEQLRSLLGDAGYSDFRSARGPLGLSQRQGLGKFTGPEAALLIEQLELDKEQCALDAGAGASDGTATAAPRPLRDTPTDALVAELQLRGWKCSET